MHKTIFTMTAISFGLALAGTPAMAQSTLSPAYDAKKRYPVVQYQTVTRPVRRDCTQLELMAKIKKSQCGAIPLSVVVDKYPL